MRILLDTHCWLWMQADPERFRPAARNVVADPQNELFFSVASGWEIAVKHALGKLALPEPPASYVPARLERQGVRTLAVELRHALAVAELPSHHRDPFDRLLVCQARLEGLTLLTADRQLAAYEGIELSWA